MSHVINNASAVANMMFMDQLDRLRILDGKSQLRLLHQLFWYTKQNSQLNQQQTLSKEAPLKIAIFLNVNFSFSWKKRRNCVI